jgi:hypothetical protein
MMDGIPMVQLKDGASVPKVTVTTALMNLQHLRNTNPVALFELVEIARNPGHVPFPGTKDALQKMSMLDGLGKIHDDTRKVIVNAIPGDLMELRIVDPMTGE